MNRMQMLMNRERGIACDLNYDFALGRLCAAKEDCWRGITPSPFSPDFNPEPPIFSAKFANCDGHRHLLALANEDGKIALQDTTQRNQEPYEKALEGSQCHYNAVFDLEWAPGQMKFVSASGDHTAHLWQVDNAGISSVRAFMGHTRSVKTAAFRRNDPSVFATGGRDGAILIWDTRAHLNENATPRADNCIYSGHVGGPATPSSNRRRLRAPKLSGNSSSITGLAFQDTNTLISCGAGDGVIKVWDLRRNYTAYKKEPLPRHSLPYAGNSTFKGFTNLIVDEAGLRLYVNCMDNRIYCYNLCSYDPKPIMEYKGLTNTTFYIKACLSPDSKYLLSGSSDEKAYIWNVKYPDEPLVSLSGHNVEVTCVAWGSTHDRPIVTCSDDARHKIWRIGPEDIGKSNDLYSGHAQFVRTFSKKLNGATHKYNLRELESTPRSMKRLIEQNERTPNSTEKLMAKRSFLEMLGSAAAGESTEEQEKKRTRIETKGRRLFSPANASPTTAASTIDCLTQHTRCLNLQLASIPEDCASSSNAISPVSRNQRAIDCNQENALETLVPCLTNKAYNASTPSPLSDRAAANNHSRSHCSPPTTSAQAAFNAQPPALSSLIFSPTSNLPNYVIDGEAPHLSIMSPKRNHKAKVDWLTKIRKQKLMSNSRGTSFVEKMNEERIGSDHESPAMGISSPRLQSLRNTEGSPRPNSTPRRRVSQSGRPMSPSSHQHPKTPTSSRRNSETTLFRFFSVQQRAQPATEPQPMQSVQEALS